jgi:alpha-1,6-mannosyltransferase
MIRSLLLIYFVWIVMYVRLVDRQNSFLILLFVGISFCFYFFLYFRAEKIRLKDWFWIAVFFRLGSMFSLPHLSDDFYRFLWDGYLFSNGESPFALTPKQWLSTNTNHSELILSIYPRLNSSDYFSVYPVALQVIFALPWWIGLNTVISQIIVYQMILLSFECGNLFIITRYLKFRNSKEATKLFFLYALNPLLIIESVSQIHFESIFLFVLLVCLLIGTRFSNLRNVFFAILTQLKLSFLFLLPAFVVMNRSNNDYLGILRNINIRMILLAFISLTIYSLSFFLFGTQQFQNGIGLFFHSFRFHGLIESFIYLGIEVLFPNYVYVSGFCSLGIGAFLFTLFVFKFNQRYEINSIVGLLLFTLFSPVNHPWYILPFIGLAIALNYHPFLAVILSLFAAFSYLFYSDLIQHFPAFPLIFTLVEIFVLGIYLWKNKPLSFLQKIPD